MKSGQTIIAEIGATIASTLEIGEVMQRIARQVGEAFGVYSCDIHRYDPENDLLTYLAFWDLESDRGDSPMVCDTHRQVSEETTGKPFHPDLRPSFLPTVREGKMIEVHRDDPDLPEAEASEMDRWSEKSTLDAPLEFDGKIIGVLGLVETRACRRFTDDEKELFSQLAVLAAIAIQNASMFSQLENQNRSLQSLLKASRVLTSTVGLDETLRVMARAAAESLEVPGCAIYEYRPENNALVPRSSFGVVSAEPQDIPIPLDERSGDRLAIERHEAVIEHAGDTAVPEPVRRAMAASGELIHLHVPLVFEGRTLGTMVLAETSSEREFSSYELEMAGGLGEHAAAALHNARLYRDMQMQALTDGLTGLYNYRHFQNRLKEETARFHRYGTPVSLLMLDVDDFKQFNDEFGHQAGDDALVSLARVLLASLRTDVDVVCRYGGEEFAVLLPNTAMRAAERAAPRAVGARDESRGGRPGGREKLRDDGAPTIAERVRLAVETRVQHAGETPLPRNVTVSIGVSQATDTIAKPEDLVAAADKALYLAKHLGKNRIESYVVESGALRA